MGIVVRAKATGVQISGNQLTGQSNQGIMLRDGVIGAQVAGNLISNTRNGVYLRDSSASIKGNTVQSASLHGATLIGDTGGSDLSGNTFSGAGLSALDLIRARGTVIETGNNIAGWHTTSGFWTEVRRIATPLNIIWGCVFLLVIVSAMRSRSVKTRFGWRRGTDPYAHQRELPIRQPRRLERVRPTELQDTLSA
jgi:parallel beta-helix repeat protein